MAKINARKKGNTYELKIAKEMRDMGYEECVSSRSESKRQDDLGIDLCYTGNWAIQCKAVERLGSYHTILNSMPKHGKINVIFHKKNRQGEVVAMSKEDFYRIIDLINRHKLEL